MKLNINDMVKVKLTEYGEGVLKRKNNLSYQSNFNMSSKILHEQLWIVMNIFGNSLHNDGMQVFVGNVIDAGEVNE
jgi:hypothetical protein